jgi:serine/threonine protein kinase
LLFSAQGVLKLGDFGLAQVCKQGQTIPSHQIATRWYRSPESLYGGRADSGGLDLYVLSMIWFVWVLQVLVQSFHRAGGRAVAFSPNY